MVYLHTKNIDLGTFWRALEWKMLNILKIFGKFYGHVVHFVIVRYNFLRFGMF
jgi:hypothetical protein